MTIFVRLRMDNRVAVLTGGGQGIGRAIAVGLAAAGCDVVINARRRGDLEQTAAAIEAHGRRSLIVDGDVRDLSETIADRAIEEFGRLDIWVNNVGGSDDKTTLALIDTPDDVFRSQLELNLTTAFQGCKAAAATSVEISRIAVAEMTFSRTSIRPNSKSAVPPAISRSIVPSR